MHLTFFWQQFTSLVILHVFQESLTFSAVFHPCTTVWAVNGLAQRERQDSLFTVLFVVLWADHSINFSWTVWVEFGCKMNINNNISHLAKLTKKKEKIQIISIRSCHERPYTHPKRNTVNDFTLKFDQFLKNAYYQNLPIWNR